MIISDRAFDTLVQTHEREVKSLKEQIAWLQEQVGQQYAQQRTIERKEKNLPIREPKELPPVENIPEDIMELVNRYPEQAREELIYNIKAARSEKVTWEQIKAGIKSRLP